MNYTRAAIIFLYVLAWMPWSVQATPLSWELIPEESNLGFTAVQNGSQVTGSFGQFDATLIADVNDLEHSRVDLTIYINSIRANFREVKTTLLSPDWFNPSVFPTAQFKATVFKKLEKSSYQAEGTLTIRGKTLPITLNFTASFPNERKAVVTGQTVIKRSDFGVGQGQWSNMDQIKDDVTVTFNIVAARK